MRWQPYCLIRATSILLSITFLAWQCTNNQWFVSKLCVFWGTLSALIQLYCPRRTFSQTLRKGLLILSNQISKLKESKLSNWISKNLNHQTEYRNWKNLNYRTKLSNWISKLELTNWRLNWRSNWRSKLNNRSEYWIEIIEYKNQKKPNYRIEY